MRIDRVASFACGVWIAASVLAWAADPAARSPRRTETVELIEQCLPAVVSVIAEVQGPGDRREGRFGSGSVIHSAGFVITNEHVIRGMQRGAVVFSDGSTAPVRVVAAFAHEDLAVLQVRTNRPLPVLPLGRSDDVLLGEPALVIGSPGGLVHSVSTGVVSGLNRSTRNESNLLPWMLQTSAAVSRGNSGGPLINAEGRQIGVISTIGHDLQNVSFAISIDHVREVLPRLLSPEQRGNFWFGAECDPLAAEAVVKHVEEGSPAAAAGLQVGDVIRSVGGAATMTGIDVALLLTGRAPRDVLDIAHQRGAETHLARVTLGPLALDEPLPAAGEEPGLNYALYRGEWTTLPDFSQLEPERTGQAPYIRLSELDAPSDNFGVRFSGAILAPQDGLYVFYTLSDDGSRLWIGDRLIVENDGLHPSRESGGLIRLKAGLHPLRVDYFERGGAEELDVAWEGPQIAKQRLPTEQLRSRGGEMPKANDAADADR